MKNNSFVKTVAASVKPFLTFTCTNMLTIQMYVSQSTCQLFVCTEKQKKKHWFGFHRIYIFLYITHVQTTNSYDLIFFDDGLNSSGIYTIRILQKNVDYG